MAQAEQKKPNIRSTAQENRFQALANSPFVNDRPTAETAHFYDQTWKPDDIVKVN
jgi:hypothetical protein